MPPKSDQYGTNGAAAIIHSENAEGGTIFIEIFLRHNGSFGFELFRRDVETGEGWFRIGHHAEIAFETADGAIFAAKRHCPWFQGPNEK